MTMPQCGLEFDVVFLPGWEEGLFPHQKIFRGESEIFALEERRLAYVGITRAKRRLIYLCERSELFMEIDGCASPQDLLTKYLMTGKRNWY